MATQLLYTVQDSDKNIVFASMNWFDAADKAEQLNVDYPKIGYRVYEHNVAFNSERLLTVNPPLPVFTRKAQYIQAS